MSLDLRIVLSLAFLLGLLVPFVVDARGGTYGRVATATPLSPSDLLGGTATTAIDQALERESDFMRRLRPAWNELMARAFRETPSRVLAEPGGWFFYAPSMVDLRHPECDQTFDATLAMLDLLANRLRDTPAKLMVLVVPSKFRVYGENLSRARISDARRAVLPRVLAALSERGIDAPDLLPGLQALARDSGPKPYPSTDSHLSRRGFEWLVTEYVAPRLGLAREAVRVRLDEVRAGVSITHLGDLVELLGVTEDRAAAAGWLHRDRALALDAPADRPGPGVLLLGDSFSVHMDRYLARVIQTTTGVAVDARYADGRAQAEEERLFADYYQMAPRLVLVVMTERNFANE
ncbi:MAG: hypothetical protein KDB53_13505 [Planctomycetes bacterium]|nr:hypothetical protein [Planctomycetota bacterium]